MDLVQLDKGLKKISSMLDNVKANTSISSVEKDLLLQYIREMYEMVKEGDIHSVRNDNGPTYIPTIRLSSHSAASKEAPEIVEEQIIKTAPTKVESIKEEVVIAPPKTFTPPPPPIPPATIEEASNKNLSWDKEMEELFVEEVVTDLNEKISRTPIKDIGKALGINERIGILSELFNKDESVFNNTLHELNQLPDFESAKQLLLNAAYKYQWVKDEKQKRAMAFIKLVRRRYL